MCRFALQLREAVKQRLFVAVEEVCELLEKSIRDYEELLIRQYERRQRALQAAPGDAAPDCPLGAAESTLLKQEEEPEEVTSQICEAVKKEEQLSDAEESSALPQFDQQEELSLQAWTEESDDTEGLTGGVADCGLPPMGVADCGLPAGGLADCGLPAGDVADCGLPAGGVAECTHPPVTSRGRRPPQRRVHECPLCCLRFQSSFNLETHLRVHTGERPFVCAVCGKTFNRKDSLNNHRKIHAGESFSCEHCGKSYSDKSNLRRHMLSVHGLKGTART